MFVLVFLPLPLQTCVYVPRYLSSSCLFIVGVILLSPASPLLSLPQGSFSRKLLDSKIIMLDGTIYDVMGKMMWKRRVKSGKFTARRRPSRLSSRVGGGDGRGKSSKKSNARWRNAEEEERGEEQFSGGSWEAEAEAGVRARARGDRSGTGRIRKKRSSGSSRSRRSRSANVQ